MKIFGKSQTVAAFFQGTDGFLKGFLIILADGHHFTYSFHLCAQFILRFFEFLKCPAREFDHNIVTGGFVVCQGTSLIIRNL